MKITKVLTTAIFTTLLINLGTAQTDVITIPDSGDTLEMEIESGYSLISPPIRGSVDLDVVAEQCNGLEPITNGDFAVSYAGEQFSTNTINGMRSYAVHNTGDTCTAEINKDEIDPGINTEVPTGWTLFSVASDMSVNDKLSSCSIDKLHTASTESQPELPVSTTLQARETYWLGTTDEGCEFSTGDNNIISTPDGDIDDDSGDTGGDDDSSDSDDDSGDTGGDDENWDGNYEFEVKPDFSKWDNEGDPHGCGDGDCWVRPELTVYGENLGGKRIRLEINGVPGWNNDPRAYVNCDSNGDGQCFLDMAEAWSDDAPDRFDPDEYQSFTLNAYVKEEARGYNAGSDWEVIASEEWHLDNHGYGNTGCSQYSGRAGCESNGCFWNAMSSTCS